MINSVTSGPPLGDQDGRRAQQEQSDAEGRKDGGGQGHPPDPDVGPAPNLRLLVETDESDGGLIYKLVNRETGDVVSQLTRRDLGRLTSDPKYTAGAWLNTKA